jgi:hypothetical protein
VKAGGRSIVHELRALARTPTYMYDVMCVHVVHVVRRASAVPV